MPMFGVLTLNFDQLPKSFKMSIWPFPKILLQLLSGLYYLDFLSMPVKLKKLWCFLKPSIEPSYLGFKRCNPIIPLKSNYPSWLYETLGGGWKCKNLKWSWERCSVTTKVRNSKFIHTIRVVVLKLVFLWASYLVTQQTQQQLNRPWGEMDMAVWMLALYCSLQHCVFVPSSRALVSFYFINFPVLFHSALFCTFCLVVFTHQLAVYSYSDTHVTVVLILWYNSVITTATVCNLFPKCFCTNMLPNLF